MILKYLGKFPLKSDVSICRVVGLLSDTYQERAYQKTVLLVSEFEERVLAEIEQEI